MDIEILKQIGFSDKNAKVYLALLSLGPSSVRELSAHSGLNRGTTYDSLQWLQSQGLVDFYKKDTKQSFVALDPIKIKSLVDGKINEMRRVQGKLDMFTSELQAVYNSGSLRPLARYFDRDELKEILEDVLKTVGESDEKLYRIYSAEGLREFLYDDFPSFSDARIAKSIKVKVIALGTGGELRGFDERKWMRSGSAQGTYIIIYEGKTANISFDSKGQAMGVVIENEGIYETQKNIFDELWTRL